jgi:hypothetical protein
VERFCVKPNQKSLNDCVVHLRGRDALTSAPVGEGGEPVRQALVIGDGLEQRPPFWIASAATPARRLNDPGKLKRGSEQAPQVRVALGADAVGGWTNPRQHLLHYGRLRSHGSGQGTGHFANPFKGRDHVPTAGAGQSGLVDETHHVRKRGDFPILNHGEPLYRCVSAQSDMG